MIFIPFKDYEEKIGGPSTFLRNLKNYLDKIGYLYVDDERYFKKADKIFFPVSFNRRILKYFKNKNFPIIQRLDGVYYPSKHGKLYKKLNKEMELDYNSFSSFVIFQSNYSKVCCFEMFGKKEEGNYEIILNGTNKNVFSPGKKVFNANEVIFVTTGVFRSLDMIEPSIIALEKLKENKLKFKYKIIGSITNKEILKYLEKDFIEYIGILSEEKIAQELQSSDIFLYTQLNPPCPNSIIEALSCGLPVVGFNGGAMNELLDFQKELLSNAGDKIFQEYSDYDVDDFTERITFCINNYDDFKSRSLRNCKKYDILDTMEKYIKIFNKF